MATAARSGVTTVTTAGTAVALGDEPIDGMIAVSATDGNTGVCYIGNDGAGDVASTNGYELKAGNQVTLFVHHLSDIMVDAANNSDSVTWLILGY